MWDDEIETELFNSFYVKLSMTFITFQFKLGMSLMKLAFNMESWEACGGGPELTGTDALNEGNGYIDKALKIFQEVNLKFSMFKNVLVSCYVSQLVIL